MKTSILSFMILVATVLSCGDSQTNTDDSVTLNPIESKVDSSADIHELNEKGVVGMWECTFKGYESIISLIKKEGKYTSEIDFHKNKAENKMEKLILREDKYLVKSSSAGEYYKINADKNLEIWDKDGLFTTAINIMPGQKRKSLPSLKLKDTFGKDIHFIAGNYSKSAPETLTGTNSDIWIVYYEDINVTFRVHKSTDTIKKAEKGRIANLK